MRRGAAVAAMAAFALLASAAEIAAQAVPAPGRLPAPPAGGIVARELPFAVGFGIGALRWDDDAPFEDLALASLTIERSLGRLVRGRASVGYGETRLLIEDPSDTRVLSLDLQAIVLADFGPFRRAGVAPYGLAGVGSLVSNPVGEDDRRLPTRSQTQLTWGGGVVGRLGSRWEARAEGVRARVRLADPVSAENGDTTRIHTMRWEGRISWLF